MDHEHGTACQPILEHPPLLQASSQGPPVSAVVYTAAGRWAQHRSSGALWLFSEFGAVYKYSDLLTYLLTCGLMCRVISPTERRKQTWERRWPDLGCWQSARTSTRVRASDASRDSRYSSSEDACATSASSTCAKTVASLKKTKRRSSVASVAGSGKW